MNQSSYDERFFPSPLSLSPPDLYNQHFLTLHKHFRLKTFAIVFDPHCDVRCASNEIENGAADARAGESHGKERYEPSVTRLTLTLERRTEKNFSNL